MNEYQFNNLPCPVFREETTDEDKNISCKLIAASKGDPAGVHPLVEAIVREAPFSPALLTLLEDLSRRIQAIEAARGEVSKAQRAHLDVQAQPLQDLIDAILFRMIGFSQQDVDGLTAKLEQMA